MQFGLLGMLPDTFTCASCHKTLEVETLRPKKARRVQRGRGVYCEECHVKIEAKNAAPIISKRFAARSRGQTSVESEMAKLLRKG